MGNPFKEFDYWGCVSGATRKSHKIITPFCIICLPTVQISTNVRETVGKETFLTQGGTGLNISSKRRA